ncbi:MAG TPA: cytochrome c oxidase subunit 3 [Blastocatellia bacterium]|nr:cytochrome c oxidase subunit 3 [Blastocatellia bacterium]
MGVTVTTDVRVDRGGVGAGPDGSGSGGPQGPKDPGPEDKDWPPGWSREDAIEPAKYRIGMWVGLASILMLFMALTSAYVLRQTKGLTEVHDWVSIRLPWLVWVTTGVLVASSFTFEVARRALRRNDYARFNNWILLTTILGALFLVGQLVTWWQLAAQGIYVNTNPHSSFFYLLTSLHGLHLFGGLLALAWVTVAAFRLRIGFKRRNAVEVTAMYWHFMDGLWIYLLALLYFWS